MELRVSTFQQKAVDKNRLFYAAMKFLYEYDRCMFAFQYRAAEDGSNADEQQGSQAAMKWKHQYL